MPVERLPMDALDDVVAMLQIVGPEWVSWYDPRALRAHVHDMLIDGIASAKAHGAWSSGCVRVRYEDGKTEISVVAAYSYETADTADA